MTAKRVILIVDDDKLSLDAAKRVLMGEYNIVVAESALRMFELLGVIMPDLIILDQVMPKMSGFDALRQLKNNPKLSSIPVIILSGQSDKEAMWLKLGAADYISKPYQEAVLRYRCQHHIGIGALLCERTAQILRMKRVITQYMADVIESRDLATKHHVERVSKLFRAMTEYMLNHDVYANEIELWNLEVAEDASSLHDIGIIIVSDVILNKPGKLTPQEFRAMQLHAYEGERIISHMLTHAAKDSDFVLHAASIAGGHHEIWDGNGYPRKLKGFEIPLQARIMAPVDVYDALVNDRSYHLAMSHEQAVRIIEEGRGSHFDPHLLDSFFSVCGQMRVA